MFEAIAILITAWIGYNLVRSLIVRAKGGGSDRGGDQSGGDAGSGSGSSNGWIGDTSYADCDGGDGGADGGGGGGGGD